MLELKSRSQKLSNDRKIFRFNLFRDFQTIFSTSSGVYKYEIDAPRKAPAESSIRYIFDGRIEKPVQPCQEKPWQGLVAQVDRVLMPSQGGCRNSDHTPETCDCGCRDPSHTPGTCNCGNGDYKLPIIYNSRYESKSENSQNIPVFVLPDPTNIVDDVASRRTKRDSNVEKKKKSKRREIKFPKLKPLKKFSTKDFVPIYSFDPSSLKSKLSLKKPKTEARQLRSKRKHEAEVESPCGYTYESCDPKKHSKEGCPLCYRCKCEPITKARENEKFSPYDIKIPYKFVKQNEAPGSAPMFQEFDNEPAPYTGLKDQSMYNSYIKQIISKYPEHMSRKMPDIQAQERDLLKFIDDLAKSDKSAGDKVPDEDVRYKMMDNAMDMYKFYEKAVSGLPKNSAGPRDGKYFKKRGTVLEVIEVDPNNFNESFGVELGESASEAQSEF